ncbi:MAG: NADH:ubiquinone oxidoreductase subunit H [Candidatus Latescibacterota bacterium]|jgi:NADH:ubiquinone oxidoreductase subunit H
MEPLFAAFASAAFALCFVGAGCIFSAFCERRVVRVQRMSMWAELVRLMARSESHTARAAPLLAWLAPVLMLAALPVASVHPLGVQVPASVAPWGVMTLVAFAPLAALAPLWAGWCSAEHLALLGGVRAAVMHLSYTSCLALILAAAALATGAPELVAVVERQSHSLGPLPRWNIFLQPVGAVVFLGWLFVWSEREPFGSGGASGVLAPGYRRGFVGGDLVLLRLADHARLFIGAALGVVLFGGGWHDPSGGYLNLAAFLNTWAEVGVFLVKVLILVAILAWLRRVLPCFDYGQSLRLLFFLFLPLALANLLWVAFVVTAQGV